MLRREVSQLGTDVGTLAKVGREGKEGKKKCREGRCKARRISMREGQQG
jgi:hypothetical protein